MTLLLPTRAGRVTVATLGRAVYRTRTLRGAFSGVLAAAVWALAQPLDKLLLESDYDDVELLGRAVVSGEGWYPAGIAIHIGNGALFGALYANVAPVLPLPPVLRGPTFALSEQLALWPLMLVSDRVHPARKQLPELAGNRRAFAQAAIRHLLFGLVLGELERRLNTTPEPAPLLTAQEVSSNGHGSLEQAMPAGST